MDGTPAVAAEGGQLSAATVFIQRTTVRTFRFLEEGQRPPYAQSTGSGTGVALRDGMAYDIRWSRPEADGGTTLTTTSGRPMTFARGPVWIVLTAAPRVGGARRREPWLCGSPGTFGPGRRSPGAR